MSRISNSEDLSQSEREKYGIPPKKLAIDYLQWLQIKKDEVEHQKKYEEQQNVIRAERIRKQR